MLKVLFLSASSFCRCFPPPSAEPKDSVLEEIKVGFGVDDDGRCCWNDEDGRELLAPTLTPSFLEDDEAPRGGGGGARIGDRPLASCFFAGEGVVFATVTVERT